MCHLLRQPAIDLFGGVVVTEDDIAAWVVAVSPVHATDRLFDRYVASYNVADKVRRAKMDGTFDEIVTRPRRIWHARFALSQIL